MTEDNEKDGRVRVSVKGVQYVDAYIVDSEYQRKVDLLNGSLQEIGMGRHQVCSYSCLELHSERACVVGFVCRDRIRLVRVSFWSIYMSTMF